MGRVRLLMGRDRPARKRERLDVRVSPEQKAQFQQAALLAGCTLTDFVIRSVQSAADETIRNQQVMTLSARDSTAFVEALLNPPAPNEHLRAAVERYHAFTGE